VNGELSLIVSIVLFQKKLKIVPKNIERHDVLTLRPSMISIMLTWMVNKHYFWCTCVHCTDAKNI